MKQRYAWNPIFIIYYVKTCVDLGIRVSSPGHSFLGSVLQAPTKKFPETKTSDPDLGLVKLTSFMENGKFKPTKVITRSQHLALPKNIDQPRCAISKPPSPQVSATHPSRRGAGIISRQSQRPSTSSHPFSHHCRLENSLEESHQRISRSHKTDTDEFVRAHEEPFEEFWRRHMEKEPLEGRHRSRSPQCHWHRKWRCHHWNRSTSHVTSVVEKRHPQRKQDTLMSYIRLSLPRTQSSKVNWNKS